MTCICLLKIWRRTTDRITQLTRTVRIKLIPRQAFVALLSRTSLTIFIYRTTLSFTFIFYLIEGKFFIAFQTLTRLFSFNFTTWNLRICSNNNTFFVTETSFSRSRWRTYLFWSCVKGFIILGARFGTLKSNIIKISTSTKTPMTNNVIKIFGIILTWSTASVS